MKHHLAFISLLALITGLKAEDMAEKASHYAKVTDIEMRLLKAPDFEARGLEARKLQDRQWVEIEAEVEVRTTNPSGYIPELQATWYAVVMQNKLGNGAKEIPFMLSGTSSFKDVRAKDGKIFLSAYIQPRTLERFLGEGRIRKSDFKTFAIRLSGAGFPTEGAPLRDLALSTDEKIGPMLENWKYKYSREGIVAKSQSPFAMMWIDRYPAEKVVQ